MHWPLLDRLYLILLEIVAPATVLATVIYWPAHRKSLSSVGKAAYLMEGANAGILLLEIVLARIPFVSYHWQVCSIALPAMVRSRSCLLMAAWPSVHCMSPYGRAIAPQLL